MMAERKKKFNKKEKKIKKKKKEKTDFSVPWTVAKSNNKGT